MPSSSEYVLLALLKEARGGIRSAELNEDWADSIESIRRDSSKSFADNDELA
jgi:hypothetical protein